MAVSANAAYNPSESTAMGQLLAILIIPPLVGLVTYFFVRTFSKHDEEKEARR